MKNNYFLVLIAFTALCFSACNNDKKTVGTIESTSTDKNIVADSAQVSGVPCDIKIAGIDFTKAINGADTLVKVQDNGRIRFKPGARTDYFSDPDGKLSNTTAPLLLTHIDNTKPFTFTAKVTPIFTIDGTYNAGVLYIYVNDAFFQKHCFEQDERGMHRIVTVRTVGTSDDSNHDPVGRPYAYMKISSDTHTVASYYSLDNRNWQMVRLYENNYPSKIWVGISSQCPLGEGAVSIFEDLKLEDKSVSDFRLGI